MKVLLEFYICREFVFTKIKGQNMNHQILAERLRC